MSEQKDNQNKENKEKYNISPKKEIEEKSSFKNLKKIRKDLMSFAKNEILNIKKSKKDFNVANFEEKEVIAPSRYSLTSNKLEFHSFKRYEQDIETVKEIIPQNKINEDTHKNDKNEVSSSDISAKVFPFSSSIAITSCPFSFLVIHLYN